MSGWTFWFLACLALWQDVCVRAQEPVELCDTFAFYNSTSVPYAWNNNAWGLVDNENNKGNSCLTVSDNGNSWSVTYKWTGPADLVKGYPYMKAHPSNLPTRLGSVKALEFAAEWDTYVLSAKDASPADQAAAMDAIALYANVAVDMFLSNDAENSTQVGPPVEVMIWPWWTPAVRPLGWAESTPDVDTVEIDGTDYSLYHGFNAQGQHVFSWLARQNVTRTHADFSPLLTYLYRNTTLLSPDLFLGQLEFGTEVLHAGETTVFEARNYTLRIVRDDEEVDEAFVVKAAETTANSTSGTSTPTSTGGASGTGEVVAATSSGAASSLSSQSFVGMWNPQGQTINIGGFVFSSLVVVLGTFISELSWLS